MKPFTTTSIWSHHAMPSTVIPGLALQQTKAQKSESILYT